MRMSRAPYSGRTARAGAKGISLTVLQEEEVQEIADFEKNWESNSQFKTKCAKHRRKQYYSMGKYSKPNP
jgi:superfamily II DNA/RNA helicase